MLTARARHRRDQFGVGESHQADHDATQDEREGGTTATGVLQETPGQHDPAETDHRAEGDRDHVEPAEYADEAAVVTVLSHRSSPRGDDQQSLRLRRRDVKTRGNLFGEFHGLAVGLDQLGLSGVEVFVEPALDLGQFAADDQFGELAVQLQIGLVELLRP